MEHHEGSKPITYIHTHTHYLRSKDFNKNVCVGSKNLKGVEGYGHFHHFQGGNGMVTDYKMLEQAA